MNKRKIRMGFLLLFVLLTMISCKSKNEEVEVIVENFLNGYANKEEISGFLLYADDQIKYDGFQGLLAEQIEYKIWKIDYEDELYKAKVEIYNLDFEKIFNEVLEEIIESTSTEEIIELLEKKFTEANIKKKFDVQIILDIYDDEYKVLMTPELSNALLGGYNELLNKFIESEVNN